MNPYTTILIIIGTNDLSNKKFWFQYCKNKNKPNYQLEAHPTTDIAVLKLKYIRLINLIKSINSSIIIELCPIIPRLFDYKINLAYLKEVNNMIKDLCIAGNHFHDRTLIKAFLKSGQPDPLLYLNDGLHLSQKGTDKLIRILRCKIAKLTQRSAQVTD